jgi:pimeloyl-ACP methyl ester carboxylesterase
VERPDLVRSLVLASTFSEIDRMLELNYQVRIQLIEEAGMGSLFGDYATTALFGRSFFATEEGRAFAELAVGSLAANDPDTYVRHLEAILEFGGCKSRGSAESFTERLRSVTIPALVMCGDEDVLTVPGFSKILAGALPNARLVVQSHCGHANLIERAAESGEIILEFLEEVSSGEAVR